MEIGSLTSPERWKKEGRTFLHRGHEIFYREEGRGEPLLLIHGFPTSSFDWIYVWPELAKRYRLVAADLIGFGFSAKPA
ncbi:MAG: alpha/beta fold hydrolase, partial [Spirochaetales bacterium]|nr:alpha/beta fold hydrolase [Spirochaetales bacterium]